MIVFQELGWTVAAAIDREVIGRIRMILIAQVTPEASQFCSLDGVIDQLDFRVVCMNDFGSQDLHNQKPVERLGQIGDLRSQL